MRTLLKPALLFIAIGLAIYAGLYFAAERLMLRTGHGNPLFKIATAQRVVPQAGGDRRLERRAPQQLGVGEALLVPAARVERERIHDIEQIARAMRAQEMLEHEAVVERSGAWRGQVQDLEPRLALHLRIEVGEIQRHGV